MDGGCNGRDNSPDHAWSLVFFLLVFVGLVFCPVECVVDGGGRAFAACPFPPVSAGLQEFEVVECFTGHFCRLFRLDCFRDTFRNAFLDVGSAYGSPPSMMWFRMM